jgi:hypothetical protein
MDYTDRQSRLARAEQSAKDAELRIARQLEVVERLKRLGRDPRSAIQLLDTVQACHAMLLWHRDRLRREVRAAPYVVDLRERAWSALAESKRLLSELATQSLQSVALPPAHPGF